MQSAYADLGGPVHHVDFGGRPGAPPVVLVHGLGGSHLNWTRLAPLLTPYARVMALDLAGFGRTGAAAGPTTVTANAELLRRYLTEVVGEPAVLVGNSMGGMISTLTAAAAPDAVRGLALVDPSVPLAPKVKIDPEIRRLFLVNLVPGVAGWAMRRRLATVPARRRIAETLALTCVDSSRVPEQIIADAVALDEEMTAANPRRDAAYLGASRSLLRLLARPDGYWRAMESLRMPVLLAHGVHDRHVPIGSARAVAARLPHWTYVELDSGHVPQLEHPHELSEHLLPWLRALK
ncbi:alpha/beta fold hydrolase [Catellatospora coxensis]|uniref:Hydrolase n=1 Tax=Catellatospora coxensis TaxID=310354 RepID=A0A8J3P843_9ACTN|nr:alpha/beta fold hydrolase [Catellatospora coxensis]GIG07292.1 hydrolase [Catellatospora coxensis]